MKYFSHLIVIFILVGVFQPAIAHENRPIFIKIENIDIAHYRAQLQIPNSIGARNEPVITLPSDCSPRTVVSRVKYEVKCGKTLEGRQIRVDYPLVNPAVSTMIQFAATDKLGTHPGRIYPPDLQIITLTEEPDDGVGIHYFDAGFRHISEGWDHLLFLTCLVALCSNLRMILLTVTGFTLGHTVSLGLAATGVRLSSTPVEALIAFSIVGIAACYLKGGWTSVQEHPVSASALIGLLHGFGFAGYLLSLDLPASSALSAIVQFNLGVETGQLVFVFGLVLIWHFLLLFRKWIRADIVLETTFKRGAVFTCGSIGAYWFVERGVQIVF